MQESSHVRHINVFLSHSLRLLLYWNPNKTDSLQWTEEDKFGFLSSFAPFDASLTKRGYKYRKPSRPQFLSNVPYVDLAFFQKERPFLCFRPFLWTPPFIWREPLCWSLNPVQTYCMYALFSGLQRLLNISAAQTEHQPSRTKHQILSLRGRVTVTSDERFIHSSWNDRSRPYSSPSADVYWLIKRVFLSVTFIHSLRADYLFLEHWKIPAKKKKMCFLVMLHNCGVSEVALGHCTVQSVCAGVCIWR